MGRPRIIQAMASSRPAVKVALKKKFPERTLLAPTPGRETKATRLWMLIREACCAVREE